VLHISSADVDGRAVRKVIPTGDKMSAFLFPLSCGPIRFESQPELWLDALDGFWSSVGVRRVSGARAARRILDAARAGEALVVWQGTTADDHLLTALLFDTIRSAGLPPSNIRVLNSESTRPAVTSRAALETLEVVRAAFSTAAVGTEFTSEIYSRAWRAWAGSNPMALVDMLFDPKVPSSLVPPLQALLARYPDSISGLGRWDLRGLHYVAQHSPNLVRAIGHMLGEVFDCDEDHVGDQWVYWRMRRLASATLAHPLLRFDRDSRAMSGRTVELTSAGRSVLDGEASFIQLNGLVDDIGGVSLNYPAEPIWLRDGETLVLHDKPSGSDE